MERGGRGYRGKRRGADGYGCASSKIDDLSAVAICQERCDHLDRAIQQCFAFAESHMAYILSLKGIGNSLQTFVQQELANSSRPPPSLKLISLLNGKAILIYAFCERPLSPEIIHHVGDTSSSSSSWRLQGGGGHKGRGRGRGSWRLQGVFRV
ncbi:hypothetical protein G4B88_029736 [Cannabis sativa]|uniref:DUF630 domain-containing protein n=1 Tax=Cannabis sativa TaxID=3483 RepID=A0A7J6GEJ8_CANSA|nr:hypothetical protein G4B88_029736 [Cannabis sativa]